MKIKGGMAEVCVDCFTCVRNDIELYGVLLWPFLCLV